MGAFVLGTRKSYTEKQKTRSEINHVCDELIRSYESAFAETLSRILSVL